MLLIAGDCDPVGNYGSGVRKVWAMLGDAGVRDLTCQIFEGGRHELHNETNRVRGVRLRVDMDRESYFLTLYHAIFPPPARRGDFFSFFSIDKAVSRVVLIVIKLLTQ